jgi:thioredoxin-related protein
MKIIKLLLLIFIPFSVFAQHNERGIQFIHNKTWSEIKKQAKKEKKYIFVDCFTTWCGPCKYMSRAIFTNDTVGKFMNENFLSYKAQIDSTAKDNEEIKSSYADFALINKEYDIQVYPTFLFFAPNGDLVHKFTGSMSAQEFITAVKKSLSPETQYYSLIKQFETNKTDASLSKKLMTAAAEAYDDANPYFEAYVKTQKSMFTKENMGYLNSFSEKTTDTAFKIILNNQNKYDEIEGNGKANELIVSVILNNYMRKLFRKKDSAEMDEETTGIIRKNFPKQAGQVLALARVNILASPLQDWKNYENALTDYMKSYVEMTNDNAQLNEFSWNIFLHGENDSNVKAALSWSKKSLSGISIDNPLYMDTYANLLYRLGNVEEAIKWETKALELAKEDKSSYQETIKKMNSGEKTWKE